VVSRPEWVSKFLPLINWLTARLWGESLQVR
jgi:hypothetical protein